MNSEDNCSHSSSSSDVPESTSVLEKNDLSHQTDDKFSDAYNKLHERFKWASGIVNPSAELQGLYDLLMDFTFTPLSEEPQIDPRPHKEKFIERDITALKQMASKELGELQSKPERDSEIDDEDILIDDINIHGDAEAELTAAESIVRSFFQPLVIPESTQSDEEMTPEEIHYTQKSAAHSDTSKPARLSQTAFLDFVDSAEVEPTQYRSGILRRKIKWIAGRFIELSALKDHPEISGPNQNASCVEALEKTIEFILQSCTVDYLEPAFLMLYKQQELEPLRKLLHGYGDASLAQYPSFTSVRETVQDYAVCTGCSTRVYPVVHSDGKCSVLRTPQRCQKCGEKVRERPCSIPLGRAIWDIVELHFRFERLAARVDKIALAYSGHQIVHEHVQTLTVAMKHRYEVEFLDGYTKFLQDIEAAKNGEVCTRAAISNMFRGDLWKAYDDWAVDGYAYATNVTLNACQHSCRFQSQAPMEWALQFTTKSMQNPASILSALRAFAIHDIAIQPALLIKVIEKLFTYGIIELRHTGEVLRLPLPTAIENSSGILGMLQDTSVEVFADMPDEHWQALLNFSELYAAAGHDTMTTAWNAERWKIQSKLIKEILRNIIPVLKVVLIEVAEWKSGAIYLDKLESMINVKGYSRCALPSSVEESFAVSYHDDTWKEELGVIETFETDENRQANRYARVLAVYAPSPREPVTFAQLSETGSVVRMWQWPTVYTGSDAGRELFMQNLEQLKNFSVTYRPHVVAVSITQAAQQRVYHTGMKKSSIFEILKEFFDHPMIEVVWTDTRLAKSFGKSVVSREEFPTLSYDEKVCISIGRGLRDPLTEVVRLCNRHNDILRMQLIEDQCFLSHARQKVRIDQLLSLWVSACGVDIHAIAASRESADMLQYVSGLDAQKADTTLNIFRSSQSRVETRIDCATSLPFSDKIIQNCIGMLRFLGEKHAKDNVFQRCDATLVHPSYYSVVNSGAEAEEALHSYSKIVPCYTQSECLGKTLDFVLNEMENANGTQSARRPFRKISKRDFFEALTNIQFIKIPRRRDDIENFQTLTLGPNKAKLPVYVGDRISCRVLALSEKGITVFTGKFVKGFIPVGKIGFADSYGARDDWARVLQSKPPKIQEGDHIDACVVGVNYDSLLLILSWNSEDLSRAHVPTSGSFQHPTREQRSSSNHSAALSFKASRHVWFRSDISSGDQATEALKEAERGEVILRHCGKNVFGIDFKLSDFHVVHVRVTEESINNEIRYVILDGPSELKIFEDLDHCYIEYVSSMLKRFRELESHPKSFCGSLQGLQRILKREAAENQKTAWRVYCSSRNPLYTAFVICSPKILGSEPQCWPFSIGPDGWRHALEGMQTCVATIEDLLVSFQKHLKAKSRL